VADCRAAARRRKAFSTAGIFSRLGLLFAAHLAAHESQMHVLFEFLPLILFLVAYLLKDIYFALGVLMVAMPAGLAIKYLRTRRLDRMYLWSTAFLLIAGAATFYFRNPKFLYWKPTAFYWALALAFLASNWIGDRPLVKRFFEVTGELPTANMTAGNWARLNFVWVAFFALMGVLNIYVAYNYPEPFWVKFKVFGLMGLTIVFMLAQSFWLFAKLDMASESEAGKD
jgi:intracellular septation protein